MKRLAATAAVLSALVAGCANGDDSSSERSRPPASTASEREERTGSPAAGRDKRVSPRVRRFRARASSACRTARREAGPVDPRSPRELRRWAGEARGVLDRRTAQLRRIKAPERGPAYRGFVDAADVTAQIVARLAQLPPDVSREQTDGLARLLVRQEREVERRAGGLGLPACGSIGG